MSNWFSKLFKGTPAKVKNVSTLRREQEPLYQQGVNAAMDKGAGGAFGESADYFRNLLSDDSADFNAFAAPQMRQFNEEIIPGLSEQFAGMGAGGLSSSGFQNASINAGTDLSERLGQIRANLRHSGAQGLQNAGKIGLQNYSQPMTVQEGSPGLFAQAAPAIGTAIGSFAGPAGAAVGGAAGNWFSNKFGTQGSSLDGAKINSFGSTRVGANSSPYNSSNNIPASPGIGRF